MKYILSSYAFDSIQCVRCLHNAFNIQFLINNDGSKRIMFLPLTYSILLTEQIDFTFSFCRSIFLLFFFISIFIFVFKSLAYAFFKSRTNNIWVSFPGPGAFTVISTRKKNSNFLFRYWCERCFGNRMVLIYLRCVYV